MRKNILKKAFLVVLTLIVCAAGVHAAPIAAFDAMPTRGVGPLTVQFTDRSTWNGTAVSWQWQFGDGSPNSTFQNPVYTYNTIGNFTVNLTVRDLEGLTTIQRANYINVTFGSVFVMIPSSGSVPLNVTFRDLSIGAAFWNWSFGDGSPNVTGTNVTSHIYQSPGNFVPMLTVLDALGGNQSTSVQALAVLPAPFPLTQNQTFVCPNNTHLGTKVLVYTDQNLTLPNGTPQDIANRTVLKALRALNFSYTATDHHLTFFDQLQNNGPWQLVIYNEEMFDPTGGDPMTGIANYTALTSYVTGGGRAIVSTNNMEIYPTDPIWAALGVSLPNKFTDPLYQEKITGSNGSAYVWDRNTTGTFTSPFNITSPILYNGTNMTYDINGYNVTNLTGAVAIGGNTTAFTTGKAHFVAANSNRTIFNGVLPGSFVNQTLAMWLYENEINSLVKTQKIGTLRGNKWYIDRDGDGAFSPVDKTIAFGLGTWIPLSGDWNATGFDGIAMYNPTAKSWNIDGNNDYVTDLTVTGFLTNITNGRPVAGDWTGNGTTKIGVVNNTSKMWYLDMNRNYVWDAGDRNFTLTGGGYVLAANDSPVTGKWNGSAITSYGLYRNGTWFLDTNADTIIDTTYTNFLSNSTYGNVTGDWTGNGTWKFGVSRNGMWWLDTDRNGNFTPAGDVFYPNFLTNLTQTATQLVRNVSGNWK